MYQSAKLEISKKLVQIYHGMFLVAAGTVPCYTVTEGINRSRPRAASLLPLAWKLEYPFPLVIDWCIPTLHAPRARKQR